MRPLLALVLFSTLLLAEGPEFDVASIKPYVPPAGNMVFMFGARGGPGTTDPTHITTNGQTLRNIVMNAYNVKNFQVTGPDTLDSLRFDFAVVVPEGATKEHVQIMWRNLLASRFGMKIHVEQKEFSVDDLTVAPRGHKLTENTDPDPPALDLSQPPPPAPSPSATRALQTGKDGAPVMDRPGFMMMIGNGPNGITARATSKAQPISALVNMLSNEIGHPVVDKTGLTGKYDFSVEYFPVNGRGPGGLMLAGGGPAPQPAQSSNAPTAPDLGLDLGTAIQQQLGLRLVSGKGKLDVIVVDRVNSTPTEN